MKAREAVLTMRDLSGELLLSFIFDERELVVQCLRCIEQEAKTAVLDHERGLLEWERNVRIKGETK